MQHPAVQIVHCAFQRSSVFAYLDGLRYFIGMAEQKAINQFRTYLAQLAP